MTTLGYPPCWLNSRSVVAGVMPGKGKANGGRRRGKKNGKRAVTGLSRMPRAGGTVAVIRRVLDAGVLSKAATDQGSALGVVPGNLSDWGSLQVMWLRYRLLKVRFIFMTSGEYDGTPAFPTLWVYHDFVSGGAPTALVQAYLKQGVRELSFNTTRQKNVFDFVPNVWTSSNFSTQVPAPQMKYQTTSAFAPTFSSIALWAQNYNTGTAAANITILQEMLIEFSEPN